MGIASFFRKIARKAPAAFDQVDAMRTRRLSVPRAGKSAVHVEFVAERDDSGQWEIYSVAYGKKKLVEETSHKRNNITEQVLIRHLGRSNVSKMKFDEAFLVLRDLEETYLNWANHTPGNEPFGHFMGAYRLLTAPFRESLDEVYQMRCKPAPKKAGDGPQPL